MSTSPIVVDEFVVEGQGLHTCSLLVYQIGVRFRTHIDVGRHPLAHGLTHA